jgi:hypothetical protein
LEENASEIDEVIKEAIECIDSDSEDLRIYFQDIQRFSMLRQLILENEEIKLENIIAKYKVSRNLIESKLHYILNEIKKYKNPVEAFWNEIANFKKQLGEKGPNKFTIVFPLNINFGSYNSEYSSFSILDYNVEQVEFSDWKSQFSSRFREKEIDLHDYLSQMPNLLEDVNNTYWKVNIESIDDWYAMDEVEKILEILLGKINFTLNYGKVQLFRDVTFKRRLSELRKPFIYIVLKNDSYEKCYFNIEAEIRKKVYINDLKKKRFDSVFKTFTALKASNTMDNRLLRALCSYQLGMVEKSIEDSFLHFWRALETLTLKGNKENSQIALTRALSISRVKHTKLIERMIPKMVYKRNSLVHKGLETVITFEDQNFIKSMVENLIDFYTQWKDEFIYEDFLFVFNNASGIEADLNYKRNMREKEIKLINKILEWKNMG